jgi:hypothetical protein
MKTGQLANLLPTISKKEALAIKAIADGFAPAAHLKGEAAAQWEFARKLEGVIEMHTIEHLSWDVAIDYDKIPAYEPTEFKITKPLENSLAVSSFTQLCGVDDNALFVDMHWKDWGAMLGRNFIDNQDRMALEMRGERSIHRGGPMAEVVEVDDFSVQIKEYQGLRLLLKDTIRTGGVVGGRGAVEG